MKRFSFAKLVILLVFLLAWNYTSMAAQCNCSWLYRMPIVIHNNGSTALSNYQVSITINTAALVAAGQMLSSGNDILFTDNSSSCVNQSYWIENGTMNTTATVIWIKVSSVPASGNDTINMYYGNSSVGSAASSGDNTFLLFDDFLTPSLNGAKWTYTGTLGYSISGGVITIVGGGYGEVESVSSLTNAALAGGYYEEIKVVNAAGNWPSMAESDNNFYSSGATMFYNNGTMEFGQTQNTGGISYAGFITNSIATGGVSGLWSLARTSSGTVCSWPSGSFTYTNSGGFTASPQYCAFGPLNSGSGIMQVDWFRARQYYPAGTTQTQLTAVANTASAITGTANVCIGLSSTLSDAGTGTWASSNTAIATIGASTGVATGMAAGTATITFTPFAGCSVTKTFTVNPVPAAITGNTTLSTAITTTLADATSSGTWSSGTTAVATVGSGTGTVSGISAGNATISYKLATGCLSTTTVTVNAPNNGLNLDGVDDYVSVPANTGIPSGNGTYTIEAWIKPSSSGIFGIAGWGNYGTTSQVNAFRLDGSGQIMNYWWFNDLSVPCPNLSDGNWHHVACTYDGTTRSIYTDGVLRGSDVPSGHNVPFTNNLTVGRTWTSEYLPGSIDEVRIWNVGRTQGQIQANMNCDVSAQAGLVAYYRFDQGTAGGTNTGIVNALDYSGNANCGALTNLALTGGASNFVAGAVGDCNPITISTPGAITGTASVCAGGTTTLTNAVSGGTWSTTGGNVTLTGTATATVTATGVTAGTARITYTLNCGTVITTVTVNPQPASISGTPNICSGLTTTLTDATGGGNWSSSITSVATIGSGSGVVTAGAFGTATISYTLPAGCASTATVTVNALPLISSSSGVAICTGSSTSLSASGGATYTWASATGLSATTGATVTANPISGISYTVTGTDANNCANTATIAVSVNPLPAIGAGSNVAICAGNSTPLTATGGLTYTWASATGLSATTGATVTANPASGITYTVTGTDVNGCVNSAMVSVSVNPSPAIGVVAGTNPYCSGGSSGLTASCSSNCGSLVTYTWLPPTALSATTGALVTASPTVTVTYTVTGTNSNTCTNTAIQTLTVNALPDPGLITGAASICLGSTATVSDPTGLGGGTWSSLNANATVNSTSGLVTGVSRGRATIKYTVSNLCGTTSATASVDITQVINNISTFAGTGTAGYGGENVMAFQNMLNYPSDVFVDTAGNIYISESVGNRVRKLDPAGMMKTVAGTGTAGSTGDGGPATAATISQPIGIYVDAAGNLYINCNTSYTVRKVNTSGIISTIAGTAGVAGSAGDGGLATAAKLSTTTAIVGDTLGNLYIADAGNSRIRKINTSGIISTIAGTGVAGNSGNGGPATSAQLNTPRGIALDNEGNLYIADALNNVIRKVVLSTGIISVYAGTGTLGYSGNGGPASAATFRAPARLAYNGAGILYISDQNNYVVRQINLSTGIITVSSGSNTAGYSGDNGIAVSAVMRAPSGISTDRDGNYYECDMNNSRVRVVGTPGSVRITGKSGIPTGGSATFMAHSFITANATYQWQKNGSNVGSGGTVYTDAGPSNGDVYRCIVTIAPPCAATIYDTSNSITVAVCPTCRESHPSEVLETPGEADVNIYPNPFNSTLMVSATGWTNGTGMIILYDQLGRVVLSKQVVVSDNQLSEQLSLASLPAGVYIISLSNGSNQPVRMKVVKN